MDQFSSRIVKHPLCWEIIRGRRSSLGNRYLTHLWPTKAEAQDMFVPRFAYSVVIGGGDTAGHHYHSEKEEIFCPMGELELLLENPDTKEGAVIRMNAGTKEEYHMFYIPTGIAHAVRNATQQTQTLLVLVNHDDIYTNTVKYQIHR